MLQWTCPFCALPISSASITEHIEAISEHARAWHDLGAQLETALADGEPTITLADGIEQLVVTRTRAQALAALAMVSAGLIEQVGDVPAAAAARFQDFHEQILLYITALRTLRAPSLK